MNGLARQESQVVRRVVLVPSVDDSALKPSALPFQRAISDCEHDCLVGMAFSGGAAARLDVLPRDVFGVALGGECHAGDCVATSGLLFGMGRRVQ